MNRLTAEAKSQSSCAAGLLLGHERLNTTQIYTHVSIQRLRQVHRRTHPAESTPEDRRISPDSAGDADAGPQA